MPGGAPPDGTTGGTPDGSAGWGSGGASARGATESAPSYTLPGFYGQGGQTFVAGEGRLAKPRFETNVSLSLGYDDNLFLAPTDGTTFRFPVPVLLDPGSPGGEPIVRNGNVFVGGGGVAPGSVIVGYTEARQPIFGTEFVEIPPREREGSLLARANFGFETQFTSRRSLFTVDVGAGTTYYWNREADPYDHHGVLGANFLYRITPRLQFTASVNSAYLSQPDLFRVNTPDQPTIGDLVNTVSRSTLSYRVTPRFSLSASASYNSNYFFEEAEQTGNFSEIIVGTEARYLWSPRYTFLIEYRHGMTAYPNLPTLDSSTNYLLVGTEFVINRRLTGSLRVGESFRQFEQGGETAVTPYAEATLGYRTSARSILNWNTRFGFEEPGGPSEERVVLRTGLNYVYAFTPRLRGTVALNVITETTTYEAAVEENERFTFDSHLGLAYTLTEHFGVNLSYNFTNVTSNRDDVGYYRNRIYFGGQFHF